VSAARSAAGSGGSRRSWGWHPLTDEWATRVVAGAGVRPGELVLDIGAGAGALTAPLVRAGARVIAVELHPGRAERLAARFAGAPVSVLRLDARDLRLPNRPFRVVASPPYGIGSALLRLLTSRGSRLVAADLVLQRAVVRRWAAADPRRAAVGHGRWTATAGQRLPRSAFRVPPQADSDVLMIRRR
jgi:23S rRNA (adenine-N6)-dimethyltransferase